MLGNLTLANDNGRKVLADLLEPRYGDSEKAAAIRTAADNLLRAGELLDVATDVPIDIIANLQGQAYGWQPTDSGPLLVDRLVQALVDERGSEVSGAGSLFVGEGL